MIPSQAMGETYPSNFEEQPFRYLDILFEHPFWKLARKMPDPMSPRHHKRRLIPGWRVEYHYSRISPRAGVDDVIYSKQTYN